MIQSLTAVMGIHEVLPAESGSAPSAREDLTKIGTQSVIDHEPVGIEPDI
jgi:hypothetical protein